MSFVDVLLRGAGMSGQALALGGVAFVLVVLRNGVADEDRQFLAPRALWLTALGAGILAAAQLMSVALELGALTRDGQWPVGAALDTLYFRASLVRLVACAGLMAAAAAVARRLRGSMGWALGTPAAIIAAMAALMSHAVAQVHGRWPLVVLTALHQIAAVVWVGGLMHLLVAAFKGERPCSVPVLHHFSRLALACVIAIAASGVGLAAAYIGSPAALIGTAYGFMVATKVVMLAGLLALAAPNRREVRRLADGQAGVGTRLRQFLEVEIGLGVTVLFVASSLTSTPPARDVLADRATVAEVATIFTPQWPRLASPTHAELAITGALADRSAARTAQDTAWSEYNHHIAGLVVLILAGLSLVSQTARGGWARHWPLLLLGLAAFLFVRDDPEAWPLGAIGFWESMRDVEVVQHRVFVLVLVLFGLFEWMVRTHRLRSPRWAYVFPMICAVGGALLLTHSHAVSNLKSQFLMEITHTPLALLGLVAGWARWLELRLPDRGHGVPERVWAIALVLVGVLLLMYREG